MGCTSCRVFNQENSIIRWDSFGWVQGYESQAGERSSWGSWEERLGELWNGGCWIFLHERIVQESLCALFQFIPRLNGDGQQGDGLFAGIRSLILATFPVLLSLSPLFWMDKFGSSDFGLIGPSISFLRGRYSFLLYKTGILAWLRRWDLIFSRWRMSFRGK